MKAGELAEAAKRFEPKPSAASKMLEEEEGANEKENAGAEDDD